MIDLVEYKDITNVYGEHGDTSDMELLTFPFKMFLSWRPEIPVEQALVHKSIRVELEEAFNTILSYYGESFIYENRLASWGGAYNDRYSTGSQRWSVHAWALAVDYLPHLGLYGEPSMMPYPIVEAFKAQGFIWGGEWSRPDGMHFTAIKE